MTNRGHDEILRSTVRLARLVFTAAAASVFLCDEANGTLVFEASSGVGEDRLVGVALPGDHGIVGWVANTGEALIVSGVADDQRFDVKFAQSTGLVPDVIMAVPLEHDGTILGVLEVLDPAPTDGHLNAIDVLTELANQSAAVLALSLAERRTTHALPHHSSLARIISCAEKATGRRSEHIHNLLSAVADLLEAQS